MCQNSKMGKIIGTFLDSNLWSLQSFLFKKSDFEAPFMVIAH